MRDAICAGLTVTLLTCSPQLVHAQSPGVLEGIAANPRDGLEYIRIEPGEFVMGASRRTQTAKRRRDRPTGSCSPNRCGWGAPK